MIQQVEETFFDHPKTNTLNSKICPSTREGIVKIVQKIIMAFVSGKVLKLDNNKKRVLIKLVRAYSELISAYSSLESYGLSLLTPFSFKTFLTTLDKHLSIAERIPLKHLLDLIDKVVDFSLQSFDWHYNSLQDGHKSIPMYIFT